MVTRRSELTPSQGKAPRNQTLEAKASKCAICKKFEMILLAMNNVNGSSEVNGLNIETKSILLKTIPTQKILTPSQMVI